MADFKIVANNKDEIRNLSRNRVEEAIEACGIAAEAYTVQNIDDKKIVDSGNLKGSITHEVIINGKNYEAQIGTSVEYGIYNEFGTGKYVAGGRDTPWAWKDAKGNWHRTSGIRARSFLKPAIADHADVYKKS